MSFAEVAHFLERIGHQASAAVNRVGTAIILVMMVLTTADVLLRYIFNRPITGAYEVTELLMLVVTALGLAYTQSRKGHISIELLSSRFSPRGQSVNDLFAYLICLGICVLMAWRLLAAARVQQINNVIASEAVRIPIYPFYYLLGLGIALLCLVYIVDIINSLLRVMKK